MKYYLTFIFVSLFAFFFAGNVFSATGEEWCQSHLLGAYKLCYATQTECESGGEKCEKKAVIGPGPVSSNQCSSHGGNCIDASGSCTGSTISDTDCNTSGKVCCVSQYCLSQATDVCFDSLEKCQNRNAYPGQTCQLQTRKPTATVVVPPGAVTESAQAVHEGSGLIPCGSADDPGAAEDCGFNYFITLVQTIINFLLFVIAMPLAAIAFAYAGWLYMSAAGDEGKVKKAHEIFLNVVIGFVIALAGWLIVNTIITGLGVGSEFNFLGR